MRGKVEGREGKAVEVQERERKGRESVQHDSLSLT